MYNHLLYFSYWIVNSIVLFIFNSLFSGNVVLGNWKFGSFEASIYAGFWITFLVWSLWDFAMAKGVKFDTVGVTLGYFWLANAFSFWLVSRFSQYSGFGMSAYIWAFILGLTAHILQRFVRILITSRGS